MSHRLRAVVESVYMWPVRVLGQAGLDRERMVGMKGNSSRAIGLKIASWSGSGAM
jgi:hypothetical protein